MFRTLTMLLLSVAAQALSQTDIFVPAREKAHLWESDTLYIGAGFTRSNYKPVKVWLKSNEAGWEGELYYIDPRTGREIRLFSNQDPPNTQVTLTDLIDVPLGQNLTFMYKVTGRGWWIEPDWLDREPKFTGPNRKGSRYRSQASSGDHLNPEKRFGHRWSVAGRIGKDLLEFGFEDDDNPRADMDFDDILFGVDGLTLVLFERSAKTRSYIW